MSLMAGAAVKELSSVASSLGDNCYGNRRRLKKTLRAVVSEI